MIVVNSKHSNDAKVFKALCDEKRLWVLELLKDGEKCACVLSDLTGIKQAALSYHMKILCESNIVSSTQDGKWTYYSINKDGSQCAIQLLKELTAFSSK